MRFGCLVRQQLTVSSPWSCNADDGPRWFPISGRMYRYATVDRGNFSDDSGVLWMVLSFANEPLELSR